MNENVESIPTENMADYTIETHFANTY